MNHKEHWLIPIIAKQVNGNYRQSDLFSRFVRCGLFCLSLVYRLIIHVRNWAYDVRLLKISEVATPVISIGNLTTGGTGKTPMVMWLLTRLHGVNDRELAVVSRGYHKLQGASLNDEGQEIALRFPGVLQIQNSDRVVAATSAAESDSIGTSRLILLDDGFQHRRLHRNVDIVLIDATNPFGFGNLLPSGLLREPISSLKRADVVILTRSDLVTDDAKSRIRETVLNENPKLIWAEAALVFDKWQRLSGETVSLNNLKSRKVAAFCGVGNPDSFRSALLESLVNLGPFKAFPDHHHYSTSEIGQIVQSAVELNCEAIVCTCKDLVKIPKNTQSPIPIYALVADVKMAAGEKELLEVVDRITNA